MNTKSLLTKKAILTIAAIASVAIIANLTLLQSTEAATAFIRGVDYPTAEGIQAIVTFKFIDGEETIKFPVFTQTSRVFEPASLPTFNLEGVVGDYPLLHNAVDEAKVYSMKEGERYNFDNRYFDVDVSIRQAGNEIRDLKYTDCFVTKYSIDTQLDKEEGYFPESKKTGFVLLDKYSFECQGYETTNPGYDALYTNKHEYKTTSTMAYELKQSELQQRINEFQLGTQTKGQ